MENSSKIPRIDLRAIKAQIDRLVEYGKQHSDDRQPLRCWMRDAAVALDRENFRLVHSDGRRRQWGRP